MSITEPSLVSVRRSGRTSGPKGGLNRRSVPHTGPEVPRLDLGHLSSSVSTRNHIIVFLNSCLDCPLSYPCGYELTWSRYG